jgi:hypothetical protein
MAWVTAFGFAVGIYSPFRLNVEVGLLQLSVGLVFLPPFYWLIDRLFDLSFAVS